MESSSSAVYYVFLLFFPLVFFLTRKKSSKKLPPGSLGIPIIGQSLCLLRAMKANKAEEWLQNRIHKYAANKFIYTCDEKILNNQQPTSTRRIFGDRNIIELSGEDHKRVRGALLSFLKPEALKQSVAKIDEEIKLHLEKHWHGRKEIAVMPLMKTLTFNIICSLIFGIERGPRRDTLVELFAHLLEGMLALPIDLPFTRLNRSLRARSKIRDIILELIHEKREKLEKQETPHHQDLITSLLNVRDDTSSPLLSDEEIVDNSIIIMIAGHDTSSAVLTFFIKLLAENPDVYKQVIDEQEEIVREKAFREVLTWDDLAKMKYAWRVALESMRINPPLFGNFRRVLQDIELGGYVIPKGWQVMCAACMTHMDETIFPDPSKFEPSRFENQGATPAYSFVAFGGGPRMCPGYEFARIETLTMVHYLITGFQWKLSLEENFFSRNPMPVFNKGLPIQIEVKKPIVDAV
ncbi:hypothetical protein ACJIZ3_012742 [Penstemon smallii]|uniref:Cytochrome P450 n=1 Tax=Penstemon smallii TaxID=265156 RepID=A0ABD3UP76_9LAMI